MGPYWVQKPFCVPCFLFVGKRFQPPRPSLSSKGHFKQLLTRRVRECRNKGKAVQKQQCRDGAGSWFLLRGYTEQSDTYLWVLLQELSPRTEMEEGNLRLSTGVWNPHWLEPEGWWLRFPNTTLLPPNQSIRRRSHNPADLPASFAYKNSSLKPTGEFGSFEHEPPILLAWPCNKHCPAPTPTCLASLCIRHTNLVLTTVYLPLH